MRTNTWKKAELWYAKDLGTERYSKQGLGDNTPDIKVTMKIGSFDIEVKHGKQIPKKIQAFMDQAEENCAEGSIPIVIMHPHQSKYTDGLVVLRYSTFKEIIGEDQSKA